jgi:polar amino acid transport system permease protein
MIEAQTLDELSRMLTGLGRSVVISAIGITFGLLIGGVLGAIRYARYPVLHRAVAVYVNIFRCTPLLVQIFMLYFGLPEIGIRLTEFEASWLALALWGGAYQSEVMRAGFEGVPRDDIRAARALGMPAVQAFLDITLPLALRAAIPAATTTAITQFRSSSFMIVIGYEELTFVANRIVSDSFDVFRTFGMASLFYLLVSTIISLASRRLEGWLSVPGLGVGK